MTDLFTTQAIASLITLTAMEIVLGIDNIVFISIVAGKLPAALQARARNVGIVLALLFRMGLLLTITWIMGLTAPWLTLWGWELTGQEAILLGGGLFLVAKAAHEIFDMMEDNEAARVAKRRPASFLVTVLQIVLIDLVFSLDSVITAVGMSRQLVIMTIAMIGAVLFMMSSARLVSGFIGRHPSIKVLALSFLLLIGVMLIAEATGSPIPRGYIYFAMAFALGVEGLNMRFRKKRAAR